MRWLDRICSCFIIGPQTSTSSPYTPAKMVIIIMWSLNKPWFIGYAIHFCAAQQDETRESHEPSILRKPKAEFFLVGA